MIDWPSLENVVSQAATKVHYRLVALGWQSLSIKELVNVGLVYVIDRGEEGSERKAVYCTARRGMWDYTIREQRVVTLPQSRSGRIKASGYCFNPIALEEWDGRVSYEGLYIERLELMQRLERMSDTARRFWGLVMEGHSVGEIARINGVKPRSVSTMLCREKLVPRMKRKGKVYDQYYPLQRKVS